jgi:hypothetical protein
MSGAFSGRKLLAAVAAGAAVGVAYTLSPLTVVVVPLLVATAWFAVVGLGRHERRWILTMLAIAIALRLIAIASLFVATDHRRVVAGTLFGDESYYMKRSVLLTSIATRAPVSPEDIVDAFEDIGDVAYLRLLAFIQVLFGPAPYGLRVLNAACFVLGAVLLYRLARRAFGGLAAAVGLATVLFLPSLFAWSISMLKEPMLTLASGIVLTAAVAIVRGSWPAKVRAVFAGAGAAAAAEALRYTGAATALGGVALGYLAHYATARPSRALGAAAAVPLVALAIIAVPPLHRRAMDATKIAASRNRGHVFTTGFSYKLLDERFYGDAPVVDTMTDAEAGRFIIRALVHFVIEPTPGNMRSWAALAYLPEQLVWFAMLVALPVGIRTAIRTDRLFTLFLIGSAVSAAFLIAVTGGNIGTLVRHRGIVVVHLAWLSAVGFCAVAGRLVAGNHESLPDSSMRSSFDAIG